MENVLLLSNNDNSICVYNRLIEEGYNVFYHHDRISLDTIKRITPQLVISYNYKYIVAEDVINYLGNHIINMHISLLPWNKGASPNIWSFIENTPKGVTIHRLEKGLDTGRIIVQDELFFDEDKETLLSTYERLNMRLVDLLFENWYLILSGNYYSEEQTGNGSYHSMADLDALLDGKRIDYSMTVSEFKKSLGI